MNVGLNSKRNIPLITNVFEGDTGYINIDKNTSNLIMNIPLFNEDEMGLSLVYSFLDRERNFICGKGLNLSFMKTISSVEVTDTFTTIEITNEDYSKVTYNTIYNDGLLKNNNVDNYIVLSNNDGENYSEAKLYDKNNNYYLYNLLSEQPIYPCKYHKATDESDVFVNFSISSNNLTAEYKNKKIEINMLDGKIDKIYYKVNNVVYSYCELIYSNDFLSRIKKYISYENEDGFLYNTLVSDKEYVFNNTSYIMSKNLINGYYSKYYLFEHTANEYLVNKYVNSYQNEDHKNVIEYVSDKEVKVTDYKGNYVKHYLENGRIIYTVDNRKNIINYEYDTEGRMLKAIGPININSSVNNNKNNLLKNINSSDISYSISLDENNKVSLINDELHILGTENFEISIEKSIDINSQTGLTFLAEIEKSDSNNNLEIDFELYFNVNNSDVIRRSVNGLVLTSFVSKDNFSKVFLFITVPANSGQFVIKNIQLFNNIYGSIYEYDSSGLLIKQYNNSTTREYRYFTDNYNVLVNNRINNDNSCIYNYDYRNRVKEILYANGCSYHYEYDGNKLVRTVFKDNKGNFIEEKKSYYITKTKPYKIINSLGEVTFIDYDQNERIITNIRKENSYQESYLYNNDLTIKEKQFYVTPNNKIANKYYYDEKRRLEKIVLNDSYSIKYYYDDYNNITSVGLYNNDGYTAFEKSEYEVTSENIYTGNLKMHRIGKNISNDNKYLYEYDNCDRLTKVYISNPINNTLINEFEYDLSNKLIKMYDYKNDENEISQFVYDEHDNLSKVIKSTNDYVCINEYKYNSDDNIAFESVDVLGKKHHYEYAVDDKTKRSPLNVYNYYNNSYKELYSNCLLIKKDVYVRTERKIYDDSEIEESEGVVDDKDIYNLTVIPNLSYKEKTIKLSDSVIQPSICSIGTNNVSGFRLLNNGTHLRYKVENNYKTYAMWVKFNTLDEGNTVFSVCTGSNKNQYFTISLTANNQIQLKEKINNIDNTILSSSVINPYTWNFICLRLGGNDNKLYINESSYDFETHLDVDNEKEVAFGYDLLLGGEEENINGFVTCLTVSNLLSDSEILELYEIIKENYIYFTNEESDSYNDKYIYTHNYKIKDGFSLIPLNNSFKSVNGDMNYKVTYKNKYGYKKEFEYVEGFKKHGYNAIGNDLVYTGFMPLTLVFREYSKEYSQEHTLFEIAVDGYIVGLKINSVGLLIGYLNTTEKVTDITLTANTVHNFKVAVNKTPENNKTISEYNMSIIVNDRMFNLVFSQIYRFSENVEVHIGCKYNGLLPLNGYMDMLYIGNTYDDSSGFDGFNLIDTVMKKVDVLGFLESQEVNHNNERVIKKEYNYKKETINNSIDGLVNGLKKCYNLINNEVITLNNEERKIVYGYNNNNLVESVAHYKGLTKTKDWLYRYDDYNRITAEFQHHIANRRMYEYDLLGNITKKYDYEVEQGDEYNTILFGYDEKWPDRLKTITKDQVTKTIEYDNILFGYPVAIGTVVDGVMTPEVTLEWNRNELKKYTNGIHEYTFNYNANGQRISKVYHRIGGYIYKYYYYSNEKLILEKVIDDIKGEEYTIEYLYDESNMLYGFIYGNKVYYYLKDILGNIIGIVNELGTVVCEYEYDAYGEHKVTNLVGNVGDINPFRYKGYYYDVETGLYWISSRYYSPELCRWISPDDVEYLDPESINGLNLYAYCYDNPVNYKQGPVSSGVSVTSSSISGEGSSGSGSVSNGSAPWYIQTIVGAIPDLYSGIKYLSSKGMYRYFAYKKNYYYMFPETKIFPKVIKTHKRLAIHTTSFGKLSNATFRELVTGNAKASIGSVIGNIVGVGVFTFGTNLLFNLCENGFDLTDGTMWLDTGIDTAIGMGAYGLAIGTATLATAGLAMAGVALPGIIVVGGVIILSIGFDHLIRAISGYWD